MAKTNEGQTHEQSLLAPHDTAWLRNPFLSMRRLAEEMENLFDGRLGLRRQWQDLDFGGQWAPAIEVLQRNGKLVVRADLPGMSKDDVKVEVVDDNLIVEGERKAETEKEEDGVYTSERSYGSFRRCLALPEGAKPDKATAKFKNGVLEIAIPTPKPPKKRGRRLTIKGS